MSTDDVTTFQAFVITALVCLIILWTINTLLIYIIYKRHAPKPPSTKHLPQDTTTPTTPQTDPEELCPPSPISLLDEEDEPLSANQRRRLYPGHLSLLPPGEYMSSPDMTSGVYEEIFNFRSRGTQDRNCPFKRALRASRKRRRLKATSSSEDKPSNPHDSVSTREQSTTTCDAVISMSLEESATTPSMAFENAQLVTFRPKKLVRNDAVTSVTEVDIESTELPNRVQSHGSSKEIDGQATYMTMNEGNLSPLQFVRDSSQDPLIQDDAAAFNDMDSPNDTYIPMSAVPECLNSSSTNESVEVGSGASSSVYYRRKKDTAIFSFPDKMDTNPQRDSWKNPYVFGKSILMRSESNINQDVNILQESIHHVSDQISTKVDHTIYDFPSRRISCQSAQDGATNNTGSPSEKMTSQKDIPGNSSINKMDTSDFVDGCSSDKLFYTVGCTTEN